jgi:hypothetical protein
MAFSLANYTENIIEITNTDSVSSMSYTIHKLNDDKEFEAYSSDYPTLPTLTLAPSGVIEIDLVEDNIYKLIIDGSPDTEHYFLLDYNIRECNRKMILDLMCKRCDPCSSTEFIKDLRNKLVFDVLKNNFYFLWNKWLQTQSVTDVITPPTEEIFFLSDLKAMLSTMCSDCNNDCDDCGKTISTGSSDCGCS